MSGLTITLANHCAGLRFEDLPAAVIAKAQDHVLDAVGCLLSGSGDPDVHRLIDGLLRFDRDRSAPIWGTSERAALPHAACCHAAMAHAWDADDAHKVSMGHPGTVVVPVALTLGAALDRTGRDVLIAVVAGYEAACRIGAGVGIASHRQRGWYATATFGPFGAAAAVGWLLGLDGLGMANALGLAGSNAAGLWAYTADGAMVKKLYPGRAAQVGVESAALAAAGFTGPTQILEATDGGFYRAVSDRPEPERLTDRLGEHFAILDVSIKPYACSRTTHAPIDGLLAIVRRAGLRPEEVERVVVRTYGVATHQADLRPPYPSMAVAQSGVPFCLAVALLDGTVLPPQLPAERLADPRVLALAKRVEMIVDPEIDRRFPDKWSCVVEVYARGQHYEEAVAAARGDPTRPLAADELRQKFATLAGMALPGASVGELYAVLATLAEQPSLAPIAGLLSRAQ